MTPNPPNNRMYLFTLYSSRPPAAAPVYGPENKAFSRRLLELADHLQDKLSEWEYKQLCDLAQERFHEEKKDT